MEMETLCAVLNGGTVSLGVMSLAKFCTTFYEFYGGGYEEWNFSCDNDRCLKFKFLRFCSFLIEKSGHDRVKFYYKFNFLENPVSSATEIPFRNFETKIGDESFSKFLLSNLINSFAKPTDIKIFC